MTDSADDTQHSAMLPSPSLRPGAAPQPRRTEHGEDHRDQRKGQRHTEDHVLQADLGEPAEEPDDVGPRGARVGLDPLVHVEHRAVAREQIAHRAQHDQTVVGDPAPAPRADREQYDGERDPTYENGRGQA